MNEAMYKICNVCGEKKNAKQFGNDKNSDDGRKDLCKVCWKKQRNAEAEERRRPLVEALEENHRKFEEKRKQLKRESVRQYHEKVRQLPYTLTEEEWHCALTVFDNKCCYCGKDRKLQKEHFIPVSMGGGYTKNNILPSCSVCNSSKWCYHPIEWYRSRSYWSQEREDFILNHLNLRLEISEE